MSVLTSFPWCGLEDLSVQDGVQWEQEEKKVGWSQSGLVGVQRGKSLKPGPKDMELDSLIEARRKGACVRSMSSRMSSVADTLCLQRRFWLLREFRSEILSSEGFLGKPEVPQSCPESPQEEIVFGKTLRKQHDMCGLNLIRKRHDMFC